MQELASYQVDCLDVAATLRIAQRLGALLRGGETLALVGDLGSGKTTFTKGLCLGLGLEDPRMVSSPTYVLEHVYPTRIPVHHYDTYRLSTAAEFEELGFRERILQGDILVIEWADKVSAVLPVDRLQVKLSHIDGPITEGARRISFSGPSARWESLLAELKVD